MASGNVAWAMSAASGRGEYQRAISGNAPLGIVANTERRDVSEALDLLALADTPFINKIGWGPESGGISIEWISENLGPGYIKNIGNLASADLSIVLNSVEGLNASDAIQQIQQGTILYHFTSAVGGHELLVVNSAPATVSITVSTIAATGFIAMVSCPANDKWYILGQVANEGSRPSQGEPRQRVLASNSFVILRKDVQITGTMRATDMYAIGREDQHQILMRLKEIQREREKTALYSGYSAKTSVEAGTMNGVLGFLLAQGGSTVDATTRNLTESAFNTVVAEIWDNGGDNLTAFGDWNQIGKFTDWDKNRIRSRINESKGGGHITSYLSRVGVEVDLVPMRKCPTNILFVLDTSKIKLRAKKGRKAIMEKLGKMGDMDDWQILSEFTLEMKGYNLGQHGCFTLLS